MFGESGRNSAPALLLTSSEILLVPSSPTPSCCDPNIPSTFDSLLDVGKLTLSPSHNKVGGACSSRSLLDKRVRFATQLETVAAYVETREEIAPDADKIWHNPTELFVMREGAMEFAKHIRKQPDSYYSQSMAHVHQWAQDTALERQEQEEGGRFLGNICAPPEFLKEWAVLSSDRRGLERNVLQKPLQRAWARSVKAATNVVLDLQEEEEEEKKNSDHSEESSSSTTTDSHASLTGGSTVAESDNDSSSYESILRQRYQEASRAAVILALAMGNIDAKIAAGYQRQKNTRSPVKRSNSRKLRRSPRSSPGCVKISGKTGEIPALPVL
ncbi:expressed unknown protein [Seminavis robusta]|uniref:Uncharacterized protein n=1 Tax=Seminavis robusta TaxID=568900 RepID=A0A9N8DTX9_9STRA|nr:expressed unknown protein [Seminavis robusta]|eukprot:Sro369_g128130.1 n/a (328) ;mRNA; f:20154-21137